jgi:hypothetical protein
MGRDALAQSLYFAARRQGVAYLQVPKVACTSFKYAIAILNRPELRPELEAKPKAIHARKEWNDMLVPGDRALQKLFRFTFVRNPVDRFLSFYQNKIWRPPRGSLLPEIEAGGFVMKMSITEVLDIVERTRPEKLDPHVALQSWVVFDGTKPLVDFIGKIESMAADLERLKAATGVTFELPHLNRSDRSVDPAPEPNQAELARIARFLADDFVKLDYAMPSAAG